MLSASMRPQFSLLSVLLIGCGLMSGQVFTEVPASRTGSPVPRHTVAGTVVNSITGEPIRRALVRASGMEARYAFSGADGHFELIDIPEGLVAFSVQKPGFLDAQNSPARSSSVGRDVIHVSPATKDVVLRLMPESKIRGRVLDENGEPIENLQIVLFSRHIAEGRKQWMGGGGASTDAAGEYSFDALAPGFYIMRSAPFHIPGASSNPMPNGTSGSETLGAKYYPEGTDLDSIQPMELKPGEEPQIDFTLSPVPSFSISGTVVGFRNQPFASCTDEYGQTLSGNTRVDARTGKFTIRNVPRGSWVVNVQSFDGQGQFSSAEQPVEVTASNITGLTLQSQSAPSIPVHVVNAKEGHSQLQLELIPARTTMRGTLQPYQKPGDPPDSLEFRNLSPGTYKLILRTYGGETSCLESARSGSTDLSRDDLIVSPGAQPAPIDITLRSDCSTISGSVRPSPATQQVTSDTPPATSFAILVSDSSLLAPRPIPVGADGKFSFKTVSPGAYRVYAFSDISDLEFANPEVLRSFASQQVNVSPNEEAEVQLDLVVRGK